MTALGVLGVFTVASLAFALSASAGLGGSLILVPGLSLLLGAKEGVALAALLLAVNNVVKLVAYRRTIAFRRAAVVAALTAAGAALGARLLVEADERFVAIAVAVGIVAALLAEAVRLDRVGAAFSPLLAFASGATSGFSGTSGPLKGAALRNLHLDRLHFVGAASLVSFVGDATKTAVYADARLLDRGSWTLALACLPFMVAATFAGRRVTERIGERAFLGVFWAVMAGYVVRLAV